MGELALHTLKPVYNKASRVLILGTFPSPKSRETGFYYGHPQNRFWKTISEVLGEELPVTNEEKQELVLCRHIALWDTLASCVIDGASDSSIKDPVPNDMKRILNAADIRAIFCTGKKSYALYQKYCYPRTGREAICLPSTSPANCSQSLENLIQAYRVILDYLEE